MPLIDFISNPISDPQSWDVCNVAGKINPGYCEVGEFKRENEWDVKKGKGAVGGAITFVQKPPAKGSIKFFLWEDKHFNEWIAFRKLFKYDPTKKAIQAIDLYHPSLAEIDITSVVTQSIGNVVHEGKGMYSITVEFLEYFPVKAGSGVSSPSGSASNAKGSKSTGTPADPIADAQQKEIAALMAKAAEP